MKKMRYVLAGLIIAGIVVTIAFCSGHSDKDTAEEIEESTSPAVTLPEGFDLTGEWYDIVSQRSKMTITRGEGDNAYVVDVTWLESDTESVVWSFSGTFDPETGFLHYQDCRKATVAIVEDGATGDETIEYEGGTGTISYNSGTLLWQDDKEDAGSDSRYVKKEKD